MRLNIHVIFDELSLFSPTLIANEESRNSLIGVRILRQSEQISDEFLYITDCDTISMLGHGGDGVNIVHVGVFTATSGVVNAICVSEETAKIELLEYLLMTFEKYTLWIQDVLHSIAMKEPLQVIFDKAASMLYNPIVMHDNALVFVMKAGEIPDFIENSIWGETLSKGFTMIENLSDKERHYIQTQLREGKDVFEFQTINKYAHETQIIAPLQVDKEVIGSLGTVDIIRPFTKGQMALIKNVKEFIELALKAEEGNSTLSNNVDYCIDRILRGFSIEQNIVKYYLKRKGWRIHDRYVLCFFKARNHDQIDLTIIRILSFRIRGVLKNADVFPYENGIIAVTHNYDNDSWQIVLDTLIHLNQALELVVGVSLEFNSFMNLRYAFIQAKSALNANVFHPAKNIYHFSNSYADHIVALLDNSTSLPSLCHPKIVELYQYNGDKGHEFVYTLQTYLLCGRSLSTTANIMHIHRNTLQYRLERIREMVGNDFDVQDENVQLLFLLSCIIVCHNNIDYSS